MKFKRIIFKFWRYSSRISPKIGEKLKQLILTRLQYSSSYGIDRHGIYPPYVIKRKIIKFYTRKYNLKILVETGTHYGDTLADLKNDFKILYSVELSQDLFLKAKERFKKEKHIRLIHGDSGVELKKIVEKLNQPVLFWLDGHYSGKGTAKGKKENPILEELKTIFDTNDLRYVILIDDARHFGSAKDFPSLKDIALYVKQKKPNMDFVVLDDCIRIAPKI